MKNGIEEIIDPSPIGEPFLLTEPTTMDKVGTVVELPEYKHDGKYLIILPPGDVLVLSFGQDLRKPIAGFKHPNIAATVDKVFEFKHYHKSGGKSWTAIPGRNFYFVIPKSKITLIPKQGLSFVHVEINGVKTSLNVTGGGGPGWKDIVSHCNDTKVGHSLRDMKRIASVALPQKLDMPVLTENEEREQLRLREMMAEHNGKPLLVEAIRAGKHPMVVLGFGYHFPGTSEVVGVLNGVQMVSRSKWEPTEKPDVKELTRHNTSKVKHFCSSSGIRIRPKHINWVETMKAFHEWYESEALTSPKQIATMTA